jgi:protoporphyrinogen/coproporphyrinogen III oxidase
MNSTVCFLEPSTDSLVKVTTRDSTGKEVTSEFDHVISAVPSNALARALPANSKRLESARLFLKGVPRASAAVVNVGYRQDVLKSHNGFGYLVPSSQKQDVLGVVWDSRTFPKQGQLTETRLSVMMGNWFCVFLPILS